MYLNILKLRCGLSASRCLFITYLGFYVAFNTVQVISRREVGRAEETSTYSSSGFLYYKLLTNGKQLPAFPLEAVPGIEPRASEVGGECYHSATVGPLVDV